MAASVSLCMIVKDEEANLAACLEPVADLVSEIVVVDTGSVDRTREVARDRGARVSEFPWIDDFAAARNASLEQARFPWIFWLDADDRVDAINRERLRGLFANLKDENAAYIMSCQSVADDGSAISAVDHVRLFPRRPEVRWQYRIHEQILPSLSNIQAEIRRTDIVIEHLGYRQEESQRAKRQREIRLLERSLAEDPHEPHTLFYLARAYLDRGATELALPLVRRCASRVAPSNPLAPAVHALLGQALLQIGAHAEALAACQEGRAHFPERAELLFLEGSARQSLGDSAGADRCLRQLLSGGGPCLLDATIPRKARHRLAMLALAAGRLGEAESLWSAVVAEDPEFTAAWLGRADVCAASGSMTARTALLDELAADPRRGIHHVLVAARLHQMDNDVPSARGMLEQACAEHRARIEPRLALARLLLTQGLDWPAAERALLSVLTLDPSHREARQNLGILYQHGLVRPSGQT